MKLTPEIIGESFIRDYLAYTSVHEAPPSMHLVSLLTFFTSAMERRLTINRGYAKRANVFAVLLGPPATRKGYAMKIAQQTFRSAGWAPPLMGQYSATDEAVINRYSEKEQEGESPHALLYVEEMGTFLGKKKYQEGMIDFLMKAHDCGPLECDRKGGWRGGGTYGCKDSWTSLLAATTPEAFRRLPGDVMTTGLSSRWWVVSEKGPDHPDAKPRFDQEMRAKLVEDLDMRLSTLTSSADLMFDPGKEADEEFDRWYNEEHYPEMLRSRGEAKRSWMGRRHDHVMVASVLMHLLDDLDMDKMPATAIQRGVALIKAMEPGMYAAYERVGMSDWGRLKDKVVAMVYEKGNGGMNMRRFKAGAGMICGKGETDRVLEELETEGRLERGGDGVVAKAPE